MTLLEIESRPVDSVAAQDREWPTARTTPLRPASPTQSLHNSVLTLVTVAVLGAGGDQDTDPDEDLDDDEPAAARWGLAPLPRLGELVLNVVQTNSDGTIRRWSGPSAAGAGVPTGPGAVLHLQPAASHQRAAGERSLAIQADQDRRPSREGYCRRAEPVDW